MATVPEDRWCSCQPRTTIGGKEYPPAAALGLSWFGGLFGGKKAEAGGTAEGKKEEL